MRSPCASGSARRPERRARRSLAAPPAASARLQQREVVQHVELQDLHRRLAAVGGDVDQVVPVGLQRGLGDDVEIGDDVALARDEEARADRGLAGLALQHGADLHQLRARLLVDLARRQRDRRRRAGRGAAGAGAAASAGARRPGAAARRRERAASDGGAAPKIAHAPIDGSNASSERHDLVVLRVRRRAFDAGALLQSSPRLVGAHPSTTTGDKHATPPPHPRRRSPRRPSLGLPALARAQAVEKPKLTIAVGGKNLLYYLPLTIAETQGYFKAEGLDVTIADFAGGSRALQALVGGSADVVSGAFEHTINMQVKGQRLRAFVLQGRAPQIVLGINPKTMPNFKSIGRPEGQEDRRHGAGLVHQRPRQLRARQGRPQAERRLDHRRRRRQRRGRGDALGPDRRDHATSIR